MVGDNTYGNVVVLVVAVFLTSNFADGIEYSSYGINLEEIVNPLHYAGKSLKAHSRIYVLLDELGIVSLTVIVEL